MDWYAISSKLLDPPPPPPPRKRVTKSLKIVPVTPTALLTRAGISQDQGELYVSCLSFLISTNELL